MTNEDVASVLGSAVNNIPNPVLIFQGIALVKDYRDNNNTLTNKHIAFMEQLVKDIDESGKQDFSHLISIFRELFESPGYEQPVLDAYLDTQKGVDTVSKLLSMLSRKVIDKITKKSTQALLNRGETIQTA